MNQARSFDIHGQVQQINLTLPSEMHTPVEMKRYYTKMVQNTIFPAIYIHHILLIVTY